MLRQQAALLNKIGIVLDLAMIVLAFVLAHQLRSQFGGGLRPALHYIWIPAFAAPVWLLLLGRYGLYRSIRKIPVSEIATRLINVHLFGGLTVAALIFMIHQDSYSRSLYMLFLVFSFLLLSLEKAALRYALGVMRARGMNVRYIIIVGTQDKSRRFRALLEEHADWGLKVVGFVQAADGPLRSEVDGHKVLGRLDDLIEICKANPVDEVVFCLPKDYMIDVEKYIKDFEELGITLQMVLDFYDVHLYKKEISFFHGELPILTFYTKSLDSQQLFLKRILDICGAMVGLGLLLLMLPFVAWAIKRNSPGPVFFGQERVGQGGRIFKCWKFRSMYIDAEERKQDLLAQNEMQGAIFKIKADPRITRVGRFLRRTSLDEFPQFWNVLRGEMSLVGTRPPTPAEVAQYENWQRRRITIKPGLTGKWQVSGRNSITDFDEIVRLDLDYIDSWNLWLDIRILFKTVGIVFTRAGSC